MIAIIQNGYGDRLGKNISTILSQHLLMKTTI
jgi:hypothetical protein